MGTEQLSAMASTTWAFAATITPAPELAEYNLLTLTGNVTIANPLHPVLGMTLILQFTQDATGGRTVTWGNAFNTAAQISQAPNAVTVVSFRFDGTSWQQVAGALPVDQNGNITMAAGLFAESNQDTITANAGGGQAGATLLSKEVSRVTTVATAGDSVKLPPAVLGVSIYVINHGANAMQVFGSGTDQIDDVASATGVSQMVSSLVLYSCTTAGKWYSNGIGTGFSGQFPTVSYLNNIAANPGGGQGSATLLTNVINRVVTVGTAGDSVKLPVSAGGMQVTVVNAHATNSVNVFPNAGEAINALAVNTAFAVAAGKTATFFCPVAGTWHALLSA